MENEKLIHDYHNGRLSATEVQSFKTRLTTDTDLAQEYASYRDINNAIRDHERSDLKKILQDLESQEEEVPEIPQDETISFGKRYRHIYIAAAVIVFAIIGFQFLEQDPSGEDLYASYYQTYPNTLQPIVRGDTGVDDLSLAFQAYEANEYTEAVAYFNTALDNEYNPDVAFYKAMSLLNLGQETAALTIIQSLKDKSTTYKPQLYWYGALLALKNDNKTRAKEQLDSLYQLKSGYKDNAVRTLRDELEE